jgi:hypothetical protein
MDIYHTFSKGIPVFIYVVFIYATYPETQLEIKTRTTTSGLAIKSPSRNSELAKLTFPSV